MEVMRLLTKIDGTKVKEWIVKKYERAWDNIGPYLKNDGTNDGSAAYSYFKGRIQAFEEVLDFLTDELTAVQYGKTSITKERHK